MFWQRKGSSNVVLKRESNSILSHLTSPGLDLIYMEVNVLNLMNLKMSSAQTFVEANSKRSNLLLR